MNYRKIFWGTILVILGLLLILKNIDAIHFTWVSIFRMWPLFLIFWGISILPIKEYVKLALLYGALIFGVAFFYKSDATFFPKHWNVNIDKKRDRDERIERNKDNNEWEKEFQEDWDEKSSDFEVQELSEPFEEEITDAKLNIVAAIGHYKLGGKTNKLFEFKKEGDLRYQVTSSVEDGFANVNVNMKKAHLKDEEVDQNEVMLKLNPSPVWDFNVEAGASKVEFDLSDYKVRKLDIDGGATDIEIILGDDFKKTNVSIDAGAAAIHIKIPVGSGCQIKGDSFLASKDFKGFKKIRRGTYQTPDFNDSENKIFINMDAAISGIKVSRY
jgi:hypothetical protein